MPYKNPEDKKRHNAEYLARVKNTEAYKAKARAKSKRYRARHLEACKKRCRAYKASVDYAKLNRRYRGKRFKTRQKLRRLLEACEVWAVNQKLGQERRVRDYLFKQMAANRKARYLKCAHDIRLNWLLTGGSLRISVAAA